MKTYYETMKPVFREKPYLFIDTIVNYMDLLTPIQFFKAAMEKPYGKHTRYVVQVNKILEQLHFYTNGESLRLQEMLLLPFIRMNENLQSALANTVVEFHSFNYQYKLELENDPGLYLSMEDVFTALVLYHTPIHKLRCDMIAGIRCLVRIRERKRMLESMEKRKHAKKNY